MIPAPPRPSPPPQDPNAIPSREDAPAFTIAHVEYLEKVFAPTPPSLFLNDGTRIVGLDAVIERDRHRAVIEGTYKVIAHIRSLLQEPPL